MEELGKVCQQYNLLSPNVKVEFRTVDGKILSQEKVDKLKIYAQIVKEVTKQNDKIIVTLVGVK